MSTPTPREWLETDGRGGFASGPVEGPRTRRYHSLLTVTLHPPSDRFNLIPGMEAGVETAAGFFHLTQQDFVPHITTPSKVVLESFEHFPWPQWRYRLPDGTRLQQELVSWHGMSSFLLTWRVVGGPAAARLFFRPFLAARDYHSLHHENAAFNMQPAVDGAWLSWSPYGGPRVSILTNGLYQQESLWYRKFQYAEEEARGLDHVEDLAAPGVFEFDLSAGEAICLLSTLPEQAPNAAEAARRVRHEETARRAGFESPLHKAAADYLVRRGEGRTLIAGYPWFTDWGRDTFISLRGLCLSTGNLEAARDILLEWVPWISEGMLPNRFPDRGQQAEYNSVDAALWYVIAVEELLAQAGGAVSSPQEHMLHDAVEQILDGYAAGTRYGIRMDADGLLAAGQRGLQLTWMDAKIGDWVVTPRTGKPVEIEALWLNALRFGTTFSRRWNGVLAAGQESFITKFWNPFCGWLNDVVDVDHQPGRIDATLRPNQLLAVGGLPMALLGGEKAAAVVRVAEEHLLTPLGLRTLPPTAPGYVRRYAGGPAERDAAYHQGTVWPWLLGPFVDAWLNVHGRTAENAREARRRFLTPLTRHVEEAGVGHISEIADADQPHLPCGCPFQAWSVGEYLRIDRIVKTLEATSEAVQPPTAIGA